MRLLKALYAFTETLFTRECDHPKINNLQNNAFCPDCGYKIKVLWTILRCRTCASKRLPRKTPDGKVKPMFRYCQHCGSTDYQLIQKQKIHVHELTYAVAIKEKDYATEDKSSAGEFETTPNMHNPFKKHGHSFDVVEGEVLRKESTVYPRGGSH